MKTFLPIKAPTHHGMPPWGYKRDASDPFLLLPDVPKLEILAKAFDYLDNGASLRKTALWMQTAHGYKISLPTLMKLYEEDEAHVEGRKKRALLIGNYTENNVRKNSAKLNEIQKLGLQTGKLKQKLTKQEKRLQALKEAQPKELKGLTLEKPIEPEPPPGNPVIPAQVLPDVKKYITPNPGPQTEFLAASEFEVLFGGAAGGGKSHAIIIDPLRTAHLKGHSPITFRRTNDELRQLIWMSKEIYPNVIPGAKFSEQKSTWTFPAGGTHWFTYLDRDEDVLRYQGQAFTQVYWDELTQWPSPFPFDYMRSRIRSTDDEIRPYLGQRCTSNPGGPGMSWVKRIFVDPAQPGKAFPATDMDGNKLLYPEGHAKAGQPLFYRRFIPSKLSDNPYLSADGSYERTLMSLPDVQRKQLLEGNWDISEGAAFAEFDRSVHVCEPFEIPHNWTRFRACDWGFETFACCLWFAEDNNKKLWCYRELYAHKMKPDDFARKVADMEQGENVVYGVLDSSCWGGRQDGGPPIVSMMNNAVNLGWRPADRSRGSRVHRKQEVHARLKATGEHPNRKTGLTIFNNCINLIRTLPIIPLDKTDPEDVDTRTEDHAYDALGYGCASRPYGRALRYSFTQQTAVPVRYADNVFGY